MTASPNWKCPDGVRILPAGAPREQWREARHAGIGASEVASIIGTHDAYSTPYDVWATKTSPLDPEDTSNELLRMGHDIEEVVARRFTEQTGTVVRRHGLVRSKKYPHLVASVDRLTSDGGVLECKVHTQYAKAGAEWANGAVPVRFAVQGQTQLLVTGRSHVYFAALVPGVGFYVQRQGRDEALMQQIVNATAAFWRHVEDGTPPPIDPLTATDEELRARFPHVIDPGSTVEAAIPEWAELAAQRWAELLEQEKAVKAAKAEVQRQVEAAIGDREYLTVGGRPLFRWQEVESSRFDTAAFKKQHPDLAREFTKASTSRRFSLAAAKKEKAA